MELRIGERDPNTGLYHVIWPDGSTTLNGRKISNAEHQVGDLMRASEGSDGIILLEGASAIEIEPWVPDGEKDGYLGGQVWNRPDEEIGLSFETESTFCRPGGRIDIVAKFDRRLEQRTKIYPRLTGTAVYGTNYNIIDGPGTIEAPDNPNTETDETVEGITVDVGKTSKTFSIRAADTRLSEPLTIELSGRTVPAGKIKRSLSLIIKPREFVYTIYTRRSEWLARTGGTDIIVTPPWQIVQQSEPLIDTDANRLAFEQAWVATASAISPAIIYRNVSRLPEDPIFVIGSNGFLQVLESATPPNRIPSEANFFQETNVSFLSPPAYLSEGFRTFYYVVP